MLSVYNNGVMYPIANDDYCIRRLASGMDEVIFEINIHDENYPRLTEEASIVDRNLNYYLVKQIDAGSETAKIVAQIDVDDWKAELLISYNSGSKTVYNIINSIKPTGWRVVDNSGVTIRRTIQGSSESQPYCVTPWEVVEECENVFNVRVIINNFTKVLTLVNPDNYSSVGAFATKQLNLREINYKGKSQGFATRLYAYGKDNLTFESINDGKAYVDDNTYSNRVICAYWKDERYTVKETLLADAKKRLHSMAVPQRSYDCDVIDLRATNPELYGRQNFDLFQVITLLDNINKTAVDHQVVERWEYPYYPIRNKVILSTTVPKIQSQIAQVTHAISSPISTFQQMMNAILQSQTEMITGQSGGYVIMRDNDGDGKPDEILIMDTEDVATAVNVIRMNNSGIGFSVNGYDGPFRTAWTIDGQFTADNITGGTMSAGSIYGINIEGVYIEGSELKFGSGPYVEVQTNSSNTGVIFDGTGTVNFETEGQFTVTNLVAGSTNTANGITLNNTSTYANLILENYWNNKLANRVKLDATATDRTLNILNYKSDGTNTANNLYFASGATSNYTSLYNNKFARNESANLIQIAAFETYNATYLWNYNLNNTNNANFIRLMSYANSNNVQLNNYNTNGNLKNVIQLDTSTGITITNNVGTTTNVSNQLIFNDSGLTITNRYDGELYVGQNEAWLQYGVRKLKFNSTGQADTHGVQLANDYGGKSNYILLRDSATMDIYAEYGIEMHQVTRIDGSNLILTNVQRIEFTNGDVLP